MSLEMLAQLMRLNGGCQVTIAAPPGLKMDLARTLDVADVYVDLSRTDPTDQLAQIKADNPYGFDIGSWLGPSSSAPMLTVIQLSRLPGLSRS